METNKVKEGQYFYNGKDITKMQVWEMLDAIAELLDTYKPTLTFTYPDEDSSLAYPDPLGHTSAYPNQDFAQD